MRRLCGAPLALVALAFVALAARAEEKGIDHWISLLEAGNAAQRREAVYEIWKLKDRGRRAASGLAYALRDQDAYVRETAVKALESVIGAASDALRPLEEALGDERVAVRRSAARLMAMVGPSAVAAMESLQAALRDPDPEVRQHAASAFSHFGPKGAGAAEDLTRLVREDADGQVRAWAVNALFSMGTPPSSAPALLAALEDEDSAVQERALGALQILWPEVQIPVETLLAMLRRESATTRGAAAMALRRHVGDAKVREALVAAAADPDAWTASSVFDAIAGMKPPPVDAVMAVAARLREPAADERAAAVRLSATAALMRMGPAAAPALPALVASLDSAQEKVLVLWTFREIGPAAKDAIPGIRRSLADPNPTIALAAAAALHSVSGEGLEAITAALGDPSRARTALAELGRLGPAATGAAPRLRSLLKDEGLRRDAALALYRIGGGGEKEAYAMVLEAVRGGDDSSCRIATLALRDRPSADEAAVAALVQAMKTRDEGIRYLAAEALRSLGPAARAAVPALREAFASAGPPLNIALKEAIVAAR